MELNKELYMRKIFKIILFMILSPILLLIFSIALFDEDMNKFI